MEKITAQERGYCMSVNEYRELKMKPGDKFKVREGAAYVHQSDIIRLGVVRRLAGKELTCTSTYSWDGEETVVGHIVGNTYYHFFAKDCTVIPTKTKADIIIEYMERKAEIVAVLTDGKVRDFFTKEDADEIRGWDNWMTGYVLNMMKPCMGYKGCPFCVLRNAHDGGCVCVGCKYGVHHGICHPEKLDNTYGRVMSHIKAIPDTYVQELKGILEQ